MPGQAGQAGQVGQVGQPENLLEQPKRFKRLVHLGLQTSLAAGIAKEPMRQRRRDCGQSVQMPVATPNKGILQQ